MQKHCCHLQHSKAGTAATVLLWRTPTLAALSQNNKAAGLARTYMFSNLFLQKCMTKGSLMVIVYRCMGMHNQAMVTVHWNGFSFFVCGNVVERSWTRRSRMWIFSAVSFASSLAFSMSTKLMEISSVTSTVTSTSFEIFVSILGANETSEALAEPAPLPFVEPAVELAPVPWSSRDWPTRLGAWQLQWQC